MSEMIAQREISPSKFIDGKVFDPREVSAYLESFERHNSRISPHDIV